MKRFPFHPVTPILGEEAGLFASLLDRTLPEISGTEYHFEDLQSFARREPPQLNRVYWTEILYRCHWTAAGSLVRSQRWLAGFCHAHGQCNLLSAAACARGLIEAAADAEYTLSMVPTTLARDFRLLHSALDGTLLPCWINPEFEERLIHFTHARKGAKGERLPPGHTALQVTEYRSRLDSLEPRVAECYQLLCDLTHPGASSVQSYVEALTSDASTVRFSLLAERVHLEALRTKVAAIAPNILMFGLNPALATLKLLNSLPLTGLHTLSINDLDMTEIPLWRRIAALDLSDSGKGGQSET